MEKWDGSMAAVAAAAAVAACGGGGSGGSAGAPSTPAVPVVAISAANAVAVAASAVDAYHAVEGVASVFDVAVDAEATRKTVPEVVTGVLVRQTLACGAGAPTEGTVAVQGSYIGPVFSGAHSMAVGDAVAYTPAGCRVRGPGAANGHVVNGRVDLTLRAGSTPGYPSLTVNDAQVALTATAFTATRVVSGAGGVAAGEVSATLDGSIDFSHQFFSIDTFVSPFPTAIQNASGTAPVLQVSTTIGGTTRAATLRDVSFILRRGQGQQPGAAVPIETYSFTGTVESRNPAFGASGGSFAVSTTTPVSLTGDVLAAGSIRVSGGSGSALTVAVSAADTFSIQVDANGDGVYESTRSVTKAELRSAR